MTESADDLIVFSNVKKSYDGSVYVVRGLDLNIRRGEFLTLLGPSGSGKTTTLMMLAGFETPTSGQISLDGQRIDRLAPHKRGIGVVFQNYALFPHMSVANNVAFPLRMRGLSRSETETRVMKALDMIRMTDLAQRMPGEISGGQQQRIALARALVFEPKLVLMDEPLGALDKQLREHMQIEIKHLHAQLGITVVYVTHDQTEALTMSDRVGVFNDGVMQQVAIRLREREGVRMEILDAAQIREREPALAPLYHKGLCFLDAYSLDDPYRYVQGLMQAFRGRGGRFVQADVRHIDRRGPDIVVRGQDREHPGDRLVIAGGAWSGALAARVGDRVRLNTERGYHVLFPEAAGLLQAPTCYPAHGFYMTPTAQGLRAAGTVELGGLGRPARAVRTDVIERTLRVLVPDAGPAGRTWLGFRPSMPDSLPVIGPSPRDARVFYAFGHGHIGLTLAGISGRALATLISGQTVPLDLNPLRINRF